jgi:hypothetical protein
MTKKEQRKLIAEAAQFRSLFRSEQRRRRLFQAANSNLRAENAELRETNVNIQVERNAADVLLGEAMDRLLSGGEP